jgi:methylenetetrahydrofolate reductase (NADH)
MSFVRSLGKGSFSVVVEMTPPKGANLSDYIDTALKLKNRADSVLIPDCPQAIMRISPIAPARKLIDHSMEVLLTINCRDRNRLSFQSELLAAWALGVTSIIVEEGDNPAYGDHPLTSAFVDLQMERMLETVGAFKKGEDLSGEKLDGAPDFFSGVRIGADIKRPDAGIPDNELHEIKAAAKAGADYVVLPPAYDKNYLDPQLEAAHKKDLKCLASVLPIKSVGMARYLNDMPGFQKIPNELIERLDDAPVKARAGLEIAADFIEQLKPDYEGVVISPLGWERKMPEMMELIGR